MFKLILTSLVYLLISNQVKAQVTWNFVTKSYANMPKNYTPFFVDGSTLTFFAGGDNAPSGHAGNGIGRYKGSLTSVSSASTVIATGPDRVELNYFRGVSSARARIPGSTNQEHWMIAEVTRCYSAIECDIRGRIIRMAVYRSLDNGLHWSFQGLVTVNGKAYGQWGASDALVFDPSKPAAIDLVNPQNNRFIMFGNKNTMLVSADGVNFKSVAMKWPSEISTDTPVFVSLQKTPFGFHMMAGSNWDNLVGTQTVRHLFSKDLINWKVIELKTPSKSKYYKGVHLRYEPATNRLWAFSSGGRKDPSGYLSWITPRDFSISAPAPAPAPVPAGTSTSGGSYSGGGSSRTGLSNMVSK
jgi:hypothetical protein